MTSAAGHMQRTKPPANMAVGLSSTRAVAVNPHRRGLILTNTSAAIIFLAVGARDAEVDKGVALLAGGGRFEMDAHSFTTDAVHAIASGETSSNNLAVQEF